MWMQLGTVGASVLLAGSLLPGVAGADDGIPPSVPQGTAATGVDGAVVSAAPDIDSSPQQKGWAEVSRGVFVFTRLGEPSTIQRAANARPGKNLSIRVSDDVRVYRVLRRGEVNHIDSSVGGKVKIPGDRVHSRGVLMFVTSANNVPRSGAEGTRSAVRDTNLTWLYVDTNASVTSRGALVGANWIIGESQIQLSIRNETDQTFGLQLKDFQGSLAPGDTVTKRDSTNTLWSDDVKGRLTLPDGTSVYLGARDPNVGRNSITVGDLKHQFGVGYPGSPNPDPCYFTAMNGAGQPTYLIGSLADIEALNEEDTRTTMLLVIVPTEPTDGTVKCSSNF